MTTWEHYRKSTQQHQPLAAPRVTCPVCGGDAPVDERGRIKRHKDWDVGHRAYAWCRGPEPQ